MLTRKQLEDLSKCGVRNWNCETCRNSENCGTVGEEAAQTALVYREALEKMIEIAENLGEYSQICGYEHEVIKAKKLLKED